MQRRIAVFLVLLVSFTVTYSSVAFYLLSPKASQEFIGFGVFSEQGTLKDYFPGGGFAAPSNQSINWHFQVANRMGSVEFVRIIFRVGNNATQSPNETSPAESVPAVGMVEIFIPDGANESIRFDWELESVGLTGGLVVPVIRIGDEGPIVSPVGSSTGRDFRFIFELWTFDETSREFLYGWRSGGRAFGAWLQVWFDVV